MIMYLLILIYFTGFSLILDNPPSIDTTKTDFVQDIDGNYYKIIQIGEQWWFTQNLKVTSYINGDQIPEVLDPEAWHSLKDGARSKYPTSDSTNIEDGLLYNWFAVVDSRGICPTDWRVPTDDDWTDLERFLGMSEEEVVRTAGRGSDENIGGMLKDTSVSSWSYPNIGATNSSGFSATASGMRLYSGKYNGKGRSGFWWSSTLRNTANLTPNRVWMRFLSHHAGYISRVSTFKQNGLSIRCMRDNI